MLQILIKASWISLRYDMYSLIYAPLSLVFHTLFSILLQLLSGLVKLRKHADPGIKDMMS